MQYYEDLEPGTTTRGTLEYLVTEEEILEMGRRWDPQPFHTDPVAAEDSPFGGLVASPPRSAWHSRRSPR
jgi:acyl dehydratase